MMTRRKVLSVCAGLVPVLLSGCTGGSSPFRAKARKAEPDRRDESAEPLTRPQVALSLKSFQARLTAESQASGRVPKELAELLGITHFQGFLSEQLDDVVLLGSKLPGAPPLHLDDLLVALRNAYQVSSEYQGEPGCTIDPMHEQEDPWRLQRVEVFGMPGTGSTGGALMAARHVAIDYHLKKVSAGFDSLGSTVVGVYETVRREEVPCSNDGRSSRQTRTTHRFWFAPRYPSQGPRFVQDDRGVLIANPIGVQLLTEEEFFERGERTGSAPAHPAAAGFAESITELLAGDEIEDYARLRADFRLIEMARVMRFRQVPSAALSFLLQGCPIDRVSIPTRVAGIRRDDWGQAVCESRIEEAVEGGRRTLKLTDKVESYRREYRGGVEASVRVERSDFGWKASDEIAQLRQQVWASRPSAEAMVWEIHGDA